MKAFQNGRERPRLSKFYQVPHSVCSRATELGGVAGEILRLLCKETIGFGRGWVRRTYREISKKLNKSLSTISRAVRILIASGDIMAFAPDGRGYRWRVALDPSEILSDPEGIYLVREASSKPMEQVATPVIDDLPDLSSVTDQVCTDNMSAMSSVTWAEGPVEEDVKPVVTKVQGPSESFENEALKKLSQDINLKNIHQESASESTAQMILNSSEPDGNDDDPLKDKMLLGRLLALDINPRTARNLLEKYDNGLIASVLERVAERSDLTNPAGYVIRELEDGGYENDWGSVDSKDVQVKPESRPVAKAVQEKTLAPRQGIQKLLGRYEGLSEDVKVRVKACWEAYLQRSVPNTARKKKMLENPVLQRATWREVMERFFGAIDQGLEPEQALLRLAA